MVPSSLWPTLFFRPCKKEVNGFLLAEAETVAYAMFSSWPFREDVGDWRSGWHEGVPHRVRRRVEREGATVGRIGQRSSRVLVWQEVVIIRVESTIVTHVQAPFLPLVNPTN